MTTLYIKNMVCDRCIMVVKQELENQGLHPQKVVLGEALLTDDNLTSQQLHTLDQALLAKGFERIDDRKGRLVEAIKNTVIHKVHHQERIDRKFNWSTVLAEALHYDYSYLSSLFSAMEGTTLEQYIIRQKIERVKELLFYDELTLSEIAHRLGYSSVAHLSGQFKKVTGLTPSELKRSRQPEQARKPLDRLS